MAETAPLPSRRGNNHLAGSSFAIEVLEKLASQFTDTSSGEVAQDLLEQVKADRKTLEHLIARTGKRDPDFYDALGWVAERVSRLKLRRDDPAGIGVFEAF